MTLSLPYRLLGIAAACLVALPCVSPTQIAIAQTSRAVPGAADLAAAMAQYHRDLEQYLEARASYQAAAGAYWRSIAEKRHQRFAKRAGGGQIALDDYVLTQPPVYSGPPRPRDPSKPNEPPPHPAYVPVVADFLAAAEREFKFRPRQPRSEAEFKRAYAATALAAGLTAEQAVRVYSFEATGNGSYDVEAGLEYKKAARAITTALGYNQLLATNTVELLAEDGNRFIVTLKENAARMPYGERIAWEDKLVILRRMVEFCKSVPDDWNRHEELAGTEKGLGVHALNLDLDIGPLLQTQKLLDSVIYAQRKGYDRTLSAAALEMMNLTGDGNGFDMITVPGAWRYKVQTANFFQARGYEDNPVARRNNTVAKLLAATNAQMDKEARKPGAQELAGVPKTFPLRAFPEKKTKKQGSFS
jgi:hypothetical protein